MKKWIALILTLALALSLAACGAQPSVSGKVEPAGQETVPAATGKVEPSVEAELPAEENETEPAEENAVSMGRMEGGTYINEYAGYACDLDSNWAFYSAQELQELPANVKEILADTEVGDSINTLTQFMDVMAENVDMLTTMNVVYQKLSMQERLAYAVLTDEEILDEVLKLKDTMIESFAQAGMEVESMEETTVTFLGKERPALRTVSTNNGVPQYTLQVFDFHLGQYSVTLTATSFIDDNTQWVLDQFHSVD